MENANPSAPRVLVCHREVETLRFMRETLQQFMVCEVDTTPKPEYAFELALQRDYCLFSFEVDMEPIGGPLLYDLLAKAYPHCHSGSQTAPAVLYMAEESQRGALDELRRDARVKGFVMKPLSIERLLECARGLLEERNP